MIFKININIIIIIIIAMRVKNLHRMNQIVLKYQNKNKKKNMI